MSLKESRRSRRRAVPVLTAVVAAMASGGTVASAAPLFSAPGPAAGKVLGGTTSQQWPVVAAISPNGQRIQLARAGLVLSCTSGDTFPVPDSWRGVPIHADGSVSVSATILPPPGDTTSSLAGGRDTLRGRLNRRLATFTGSWRLHVDFRMSSGQLDRCDSGSVTFSTRL